MHVPESQRWLFWEIDPARIDPSRDADYCIARVLEHGTLADVRWLVRTYGLDRIHRFFREVAHPEISQRIRAFWRAFFDADDEIWAEPPSWRRSNAVPWCG